MRKSFKTSFAVIGADARIANPAKRQVRIAQMNKGVVNTAAAVRDIADDLLFYFFTAGE